MAAPPCELRSPGGARLGSTRPARRGRQVQTGGSGFEQRVAVRACAHECASTEVCAKSGPPCQGEMSRSAPDAAAQSELRSGPIWACVSSRWPHETLRGPWARLERTQRVGDPQEALGSAISRWFLRYDFGVLRRSASTSLMMSRRAAGVCFTNAFIIRRMATVMTTTRTINQMRGVGFRAAMTPAINSSSFAMLTPAQVVLGCIWNVLRARNWACKRPALWAGLGDVFGL